MWKVFFTQTNKEGFLAHSSVETATAFAHVQIFLSKMDDIMLKGELHSCSIARMIDRWARHGIVFPLPPATRPPKSPCLPLQSQLWTGLTHTEFWSERQSGSVAAKGTRTLLMERKISLSPPPSSLHQPSGTKDSDRLTPIKGPMLSDGAYSHAGAAVQWLKAPVVWSQTPWTSW